MPITRRIIEIAAHQGGCVTRAQLGELGMSPSAIDRLIASADLTGVFGSLYRVLPSTGWRSDLEAAVAALPDAVVSHQSAALIHGFPRIRTCEAAVTVHSQTTHEFPGVTVRRSLDLSEDHITRIEGLPVTTVPRTVVDLAAVLGVDHTDDIVGDLVVGRRLDLDEVARIHHQIRRRGKPGTRKMEIILEKRSTGERQPSKLEQLGLGLVRTGDLPPPKMEFPIPWSKTRRFDLAWPDQRLAVEWDSRRWHGALEAMSSDRARDRGAAAHGWVVLRFTWEDVEKRPGTVVDDIRAVLESR